MFRSLARIRRNSSSGHASPRGTGIAVVVHAMQRTAAGAQGATKTVDPETDDPGSGPATASATAHTVAYPPGLDPNRDLAPTAAQKRREPERYDIVDEHGRGGLGRVLRARDRELGRTVAIKELLRRGRVAEIRFFREALITARLEHPGIVPVHEAGRWPDGTPFYSMKLVAGRPLRDLLDEATTLEQRLALIPHVVAVADAIAYAHARRIIHRDLKPANVIVGDYGETVVIDWGLAKDLSAAEPDDGHAPYRSWTPADHVTVAGTVLGTPAYMAPEQARGEPGDERADVYALGAMLYSVLSGQTPYHGPSSAEVVKAVVEGPPPPLAGVAPGVAVDLVAIVDAAMAREVEARMPSARMFADELRRYLQGRLVRSHRYTAAERALRWMRRHRELSAAIAVGAALLVILGGLAVSRIVDERDGADQQRRRAEGVASDLILAHATLQLQTDPTAAWQTLQPYRGDDVLRLQHLRTEALARGVALAAHNGHVDTLHTLVPLSADELLSAGEDRRMLVTSVATGKVRTLATDVSAIVPPAVAPRRRRVAYAATSGEIRVLDVDTGALVNRWPAPATAVRLAYAPSGALLAIALRGGAVAIHRDDQAAPIAQPTIGAVAEMAFRSDRELVTIADGQLQQIDVMAPATASPHARAAPATRVALLAPSPYAVSFGKDGAVTLHDLDAHRVVAQRDICPMVNAAAYAAARRTVAFACNDGTVRLWRLDALDDTPAQLTIGTPLYDVAAAAPADQVVAAGEDGILHVVDLATGAVTRLPGHPGAVYAVLAPSTVFPYAASGDVRGHLRIWPTPPIAHRTIHTSPVPINLVYFSPDGRRLLSDSDDGTVHVWDLRSLAHTALPAHHAMAYGLRFSDTGKTFMSRAEDGTARVWSLDSLALVRDLVGHEDFVFDAEYLPGSDRLVTTSYDGRLFLWDAFSDRRELLFQAPALAGVEISRTTGEIFFADAAGTVRRIGRDRAVTPLLTTRGVNHMVMAPDSRTLVVGTPEGRVIAVEVATGAARDLLTGTGPVRVQVFDPASSLLGVIAENRTAHLLPLGDGAPVSFELDGIYAAFSPDGRILAVACRDGAIRFYGRDGRLLGVSAAHTAAVLSVRFSPDGRTVASSAMDGTVALTSVPLALGDPR